MRLLKVTSLLMLALTVAATGCKKKNTDVTKLPGAGMNGSGDVGNAGTLGGGVPVGGGEAANFDPDQYAQDRSALATETIYFDYDSSTIKSGEQFKLTAVASALKSDASAKLLVEGNCDERGTEEYNRSLGERRALASQGVDAGRVATRSYGEDRPADTGHTQSAWAKNRRDEFVLLHAR